MVLAGNGGGFTSSARLAGVAVGGKPIFQRQPSRGPLAAGTARNIACWASFQARASLSPATDPNAHAIWLRW